MLLDQIRGQSSASTADARIAMACDSTTLRDFDARLLDPVILLARYAAQVVFSR